jgi:hypothetical protein
VGAVIPLFVLPEKRTEARVCLKPLYLSTKAKPITIHLQQSYDLKAAIILLQHRRVSHGNKNTNNPLVPEGKQINIHSSTNKRTHCPKTQKMSHRVRDTIYMYPNWLHHKLRKNILMYP